MLIVEDQDLMRRTLREYLRSAYPDADVMEAAKRRDVLQCACKRHRAHALGISGATQASHQRRADS